MLTFEKVGPGMHAASEPTGRGDSYWYRFRGTRILKELRKGKLRAQVKRLGKGGLSAKGDTRSLTPVQSAYTFTPSFPRLHFELVHGRGQLAARGHRHAGGLR